MARGLTALRAALGAVGGVTDALQERERIAAQRQKEEEVMARQRRLDEAAIRAEQRQAIGSGMMAADRLAGMTMPGATPLASMQPTLRQKIGDTEYVYAPEIARAEKHRESVMAQSLERAEAARSRTAKIESLVQTGVDRNTATRAVEMDAKFSDLQPKDQITPYQQEQLRLRREQMNYARERDAKQDKKTEEKAAGDSSSVNQYYDDITKTLQSYMPTSALDKQGKMVLKAPEKTFGMKGYGTALAGNDWTRWMASEDGQRYVEMVSSISNAYAVAKEGRGASNADKQAYLNELLIKPGQFGNLKLMNDKWNRLKQRIEFLRKKELEGIGNNKAAGTSRMGGSALDELESEGF